MHLLRRHRLQTRIIRNLFIHVLFAVGGSALIKSKDIEYFEQTTAYSTTPTPSCQPHTQGGFVHPGLWDRRSNDISHSSKEIHNLLNTCTHQCIQIILKMQRRVITSLARKKEKKFSVNLLETEVKLSMNIEPEASQPSGTLVNTSFLYYAVKTLD